MQFRQIPFAKDCAAYNAGALHAAAPGVHGPIGVILTPDGEVWTWGMVLGDPPTLKSRVEDLAARIFNNLGFKNKFSPGDPDPVFRERPWQLPNQDP